MKTKSNKLLFLIKLFANLRLVRFDSHWLSMSMSKRFFSALEAIRFDDPPRRFLGSIAPSSSVRGSTTALHDGGSDRADTAPRSYVPFIASIIILALIVAATGGGGLIPAWRLQPQPEI